jgi:hypothetical protein
MITVVAAAMKHFPIAVKISPIPARKPKRKAFLMIRKNASFAQTQKLLLVIAH